MSAKKRSRRHRRRGGGFFLTLLTFIIVIGTIIASVTVFLKVAKVEVSGAKKYKPDEIVAASGIETGTNLFSVNKFAVSERILSKFPYIEQVKINRRFPDTFLFTVTERTPAGYITAGDIRWLIDENCYLLERLNAKAQPAVPQVIGGELLAPSPGTKVTFKETEKVNALSDVLRALQNGKLVSNTKTVDVSKLYNIRFVYQNRFIVILGADEELDKKFEMFQAVLKELTNYDKGYVNLSNVKEARFRPEDNITLDTFASAAAKKNNNIKSSVSSSDKT